MTEQMIFVGDALFKGGNDAPACLPDARCVRVSGPEETKRVIEKILDGKEDEIR